MVCFYHNDREAVVQCANCGKYLCNECANQFDLQCYCPDCANALMQYNNQVQQQTQIDEAAFIKKWKRRYLIEIIITLINYIPAAGLSSAFTKEGFGLSNASFWHIILFLAFLGLPGLIFGLIAGRAKTTEEKMLSEIRAIRFDDMGCIGMLICITLEFIMGNLITLLCIYGFIKLTLRSKKMNR